MNLWLWLLLGAFIAILLPNGYSCFLLCKRIKKLKKGKFEAPKELGEFDGEVEIYIPLDMIKAVSDEELAKRYGLVSYHIVHSNNSWKLKKGGVDNIYAESKNKKILTKLAISYAKREKAELKIHNKKGRIKISNSYGNDPLGNG